jgi:hypothetical protein
MGRQKKKLRNGWILMGITIFWQIIKMPVVMHVHPVLRMPLHELELKVLAIVMLSRNFNLRKMQLEKDNDYDNT